MNLLNTHVLGESGPLPYPVSDLLCLLCVISRWECNSRPRALQLVSDSSFLGSLPLDFVFRSRFDLLRISGELGLHRRESVRFRRSRPAHRLTAYRRLAAPAPATTSVLSVPLRTVVWFGIILVLLHIPQCRPKPVLRRGEMSCPRKLRQRKGKA